MRSLTLVSTLLAVSITMGMAAGCGSTPSLPDLSITLTGCRYPSACVRQSPPCECSNGTGACVTCDSRSPVAAGNCDPCPMDSVCLEPAQACVGRAQDVCPGIGARCLPPVVGGCERDGGVPPQMVAPDGGAPDGGIVVTQPHCPLVDDVCCPGSLPDAAMDGPPPAG